MPQPRPRFAWIARSLPLLLLLALAACGEDPTPLPPLTAEQQPVALEPLPSPSAPAATATTEPLEAELAATEVVTASLALPEEGDVAVLQFARIEPSPWEPAILADMHPNFTLRADGLMHYEYAGGPSQDDWYQSWLTPTLALDFVRLVWEEVDLPSLARELDPPQLDYATDLDGRPTGVGAVGVIYVRSSAGEARLIIREDDLEEPSGPQASRIARLDEIIRALELWRRHAGVDEVPPIVRQAVEASLGWYADHGQPYSPPGLLAFGTRARGQLPADAAVVDWPLQGPADPSLAERVTAAYGEPPQEVAIAEADQVLVWRTDLARAPGFWGPLWRDASGDRYLIGLRPAVPGGNHVVVDYDYTLPKRGMAPAQP